MSNERSGCAIERIQGSNSSIALRFDKNRVFGSDWSVWSGSLTSVLSLTITFFITCCLLGMPPYHMSHEGFTFPHHHARPQEAVRLHRSSPDLCGGKPRWKTPDWEHRLSYNPNYWIIYFILLFLCFEWDSEIITCWPFCEPVFYRATLPMERGKHENFFIRSAWISHLTLTWPSSHATMFAMLLHALQSYLMLL